jgi:hypothetical protein
MILSPLVSARAPLRAGGKQADCKVTKSKQVEISEQNYERGSLAKAAKVQASPMLLPADFDPVKKATPGILTARELRYRKMH